jgi:uncharacterized protein YcnI
MNKIFLLCISVLVAFFISLRPVSAHVVVKPNQVGVGAFQTFSVGVPNEKDVPTTSLRLIIPDGLKYVSPTVKSGWIIETKKSGEGEDAKITEISWTGGIIPVGQRDDFSFSAQVPSSKTTIAWKAYQTYEDGTLVSWDQNPDSIKNLSDSQKEENEKKGLGPFSETNIIDDLAVTTVPENNHQTDALRVVSYAALAISLVSLSMQLWKRK